MDMAAFISDLETTFTILPLSLLSHRLKSDEKRRHIAENKAM